MKSKRLLILIAILALAAPALAGRFPASWAGTWTVTEEWLDCEGEGILDTFERVVEMTGGERPVDWDALLDFSNATFSMDDTTFTYSASGTETDEECGDIVTTVTYTLTREDDRVTGEKQVQISAGDCGDECSVYHVSGTRGAAPVESTTWSTVKSLYE